MILCLLIWNAVLLILAYIFCSYSSRFSLKSTFSEHYGFWGLLPSPESGDFRIIWQYQCYLALLNFVLHTRSTSSTILGAARKQKLYCSHLCNPVTRTQLVLSMLELMKMRHAHGRHPWNSSHFFVAAWSYVLRSHLRLGCKKCCENLLTSVVDPGGAIYLSSPSRGPPFTIKYHGIFHTRTAMICTVFFNHFRWFQHAALLKSNFIFNRSEVVLTSSQVMPLRSKSYQSVDQR